MSNLWMIKALFQKSLSAIPGGYKLNYGFQSISNNHSDATIENRVKWLVEYLAEINKVVPLSGKKVLELGAGWTCINTLMLSLFGAKAVIALDHVRHCRIELVQSVLRAISSNSTLIAKHTKTDNAAIHQWAEKLLTYSNLDDLFEHAGIKYLAPCEIGDNQVKNFRPDLIYTYAVLAHIPERELEKLLLSCKELLLPGGWMVHRIGLQDPYNRWNGGSNVNFLKYSDRQWRILFQSKIQYNNRLRAVEYRQIFQKLGAEIHKFEPEINDKDISDLSLISCDARFSAMSPQEISARSLNIIIRFS